MTHLALFIEYLKQKFITDKTYYLKSHYKLGDNHVSLKLFIILVKSNMLHLTLLKRTKKHKLLFL